MNLQEEKTLSFKTNINCGGCIAKIGPVLDAVTGIKSWSVEIGNLNKILTIISTNVTEQEVINLVKSNGFKIEPIN